MPRKNKTIPHIPYRSPSHDSKKRRFISERKAQAAANEAMLLTPSLELYVYRGLDGGWYLTRKKSS